MHILQVISINNKLIDSNTITTFKKYPSNKDSKKIYEKIKIIRNQGQIKRYKHIMLLVANIKKDKRRKMTNEEEALFGIEKLNVSRSSVPAITHVDYSARIQTVHKNSNPRYHALITKVKEKTGCPLVVNTSFNVRGEPIVCSPTDAFKCFMGTELDILVVGNYLLVKEQQEESLKENYKEHYEID